MLRRTKKGRNANKPVMVKSAQVKTAPVKAEVPAEGGAVEKKKSSYKPYTGPAVTPQTYSLFKDPLERANAKRREEAHRKGKVMYKAKTRIPAHNGIPEHFIWVDKFVQGTVKQEETKENQTDNGRDNTADAPGEVSGVQGGQRSITSDQEAGA